MGLELGNLISMDSIMDNIDLYVTADVTSEGSPHLMIVLDVITMITKNVCYANRSSGIVDGPYYNGTLEPGERY